MASRIARTLPLFLNGKVVKGFGRGSKELGIPTANFSEDTIEQIPEVLDCGIYFGWARVDSGPVYKMVMSIGWNPFYKNTKMSMEAHLLHSFAADFYGSCLKVAILGYIRPEKNFSSLGDLLSEIKNDIQIADENLNKPEYLMFCNHPYFLDGV